MISRSIFPCRLVNLHAIIREIAWHHFNEDRFLDSLLDHIAEQFRLLGEPLRRKLLTVLGQGRKEGTSVIFPVADAAIFSLGNVVCTGVQDHVHTQTRLVSRAMQATHPESGG